MVKYRADLEFLISLICATIPATKYIALWQTGHQCTIVTDLDQICTNHIKMKGLLSFHLSFKLSISVFLDVISINPVTSSTEAVFLSVSIAGGSSMELCFLA